MYATVLCMANKDADVSGTCLSHRSQQIIHVLRSAFGSSMKCEPLTGHNFSKAEQNHIKFTPIDYIAKYIMYMK